MNSQHPDRHASGRHVAGLARVVEERSAAAVPVLSVVIWHDAPPDLAPADPAALQVIGPPIVYPSGGSVSPLDRARVIAIGYSPGRRPGTVRVRAEIDWEDCTDVDEAMRLYDWEAVYSPGEPPSLYCIRRVERSTVSAAPPPEPAPPSLAADIREAAEAVRRHAAYADGLRARMLRESRVAGWNPGALDLAAAALHSAEASLIYTLPEGARP